MLDILNLQSPLWLLAGRVLFAALFFEDAIFNKIMQYEQSMNLMSGLHLPFPKLCLVAVVAFEMVAGTMLIFNQHTQIICLLFALFCIAVSLMFHRFWTYQQLSNVQNQINHFMKNLCIAGDGIYMARYGT